MHSERHEAALARCDQQPDYLSTQDYAQAIMKMVQYEKLLLRRMNRLAAPTT